MFFFSLWFSEILPLPTITWSHEIHHAPRMTHILKALYYHLRLFTAWFLREIRCSHYLCNVWFCCSNPRLNFAPTQWPFVSIFSAANLVAACIFNTLMKERILRTLHSGHPHFQKRSCAQPVEHLVPSGSNSSTFTSVQNYQFLKGVLLLTLAETEISWKVSLRKLNLKLKKKAIA